MKVATLQPISSTIAINKVHSVSEEDVYTFKRVYNSYQEKLCRASTLKKVYWCNASQVQVYILEKFPVYAAV